MKRKITLVALASLLVGISSTNAQMSMMKMTTQHSGSNNSTSKETKKDVQVSPQTAGPDAGIDSVLRPFSTCGLGKNEQVIVRVKNYGTDKIGNFPVSFKLDANTAVDEMITDSLTPGQTIIHRFSQTIDLSNTTTYTLDIYTGLSSDVNSGNDHSINSITNATTQYLESASIVTGFEAADAKIFVNNYNYGENPMRTDATEFPHSGKVYMSGYVGQKPSNAWVTTDCIFLDTGYMYSLSFWYNSNRGTSLVGKVAFMLGATADPSSMNTLIFKDENVLGEAYRQKTVRFSVDTPGGYHLGVHDYSMSKTAVQPGFIVYAVGIDDLSFRKERDHSVAVTQIISPSSSCDLTTEDVTLVLNNNGKFDESNFNIRYKLNSNGDSVEAYTGSAIPVGQSIEYTLKSKAKFTGTKQNNFLASTSLSLTGEEAKSIVTKVSPISLKTKSYHNDFESKSTAIGDAFIDANKDTVNWVIGFSNAGSGFTTSGTFALEYPDPAATTLLPADADDYYFTSCFTLDSNKFYQDTFNYMTGQPGAGDPLATFEMVLASAQSPDAIVQVLGTFPSTEYTSDFEEVVTEPYFVHATGSYYIGFHATAPVGSGSIYIDDFGARREYNRPIGIQNNAKKDFVRVYPNPSTGLIKVRFDYAQAQDVKITVMDELGRLVYNTMFENSNTGNSSIDLSDKSKGIYFVKIESKDQVKVEKILVK